MIYSGVPQSYVIKYCIMATVWEPPNQSPNASKFATQGHQINRQKTLNYPLKNIYKVKFLKFLKFI